MRFEGDVVDRAMKLAVRVLKMAMAAPRRPGLSRLLEQVTASASSIAANLEEAQGAGSRKEFFQFVNYARREARETLVRLKILNQADVFPCGKLVELIREADEIVAILTAITKHRYATKPNSGDNS